MDPKRRRQIRVRPAEISARWVSEPREEARQVNCFFMNGAATFMNFDLCGGLMDQSTDLLPFTCQHSELPDLPGG